MKSLPIDKAMQLYKLLSPYLPNEEMDGFKFVGTIIENIKNSGNHRVYVEAIALMTELPFDEVLKYDPIKKALPMFIEGLNINKILLLKDFCEKVGFNA